MMLAQEAVQEHARSHGMEGDLVRISPRWADAVYWLLTAAFVAALLFAIFGSASKIDCRISRSSLLALSRSVSM